MYQFLIICWLEYYKKGCNNIILNSYVIQDVLVVQNNLSMRL